MIKSAAIVYFPGTGGNFIKCCLSLSPETVPYLWQDHRAYSDEQIIAFRSMSAQQRQQILDFSNLKDFDKFHAPLGQLPTLPNLGLYFKNPLINDYYDWAIVTEHAHTYATNLQYFSRIFYIELDYDRFGSWIENNAKHFQTFNYMNNFRLNDDGTYQLTQQQHELADQIKGHAITVTISMSEILQGTQGFVDQYLKACENLGISPVEECAIDFYKSWRRFRVDPFL